jgi:hypothetical protein
MFSGDGIHWEQWPPRAGKASAFARNCFGFCSQLLLEAQCWLGF